MPRDERRGDPERSPGASTVDGHRRTSSSSSRAITLARLARGRGPVAVEHGVEERARRDSTRSRRCGNSRPSARATSCAVAPGVSASRPRSTCRVATARNPSTTASSWRPSASAASARARSSSAVMTSSVRTARSSSRVRAVRRARESQPAEQHRPARRGSPWRPGSRGAARPTRRPVPCRAAARPSSRNRWTRFCSLYSGRSSSRRSLDRASSGVGTSGGSRLAAARAPRQRRRGQRAHPVSPAWRMSSTSYASLRIRWSRYCSERHRRGERRGERGDTTWASAWDTTRTRIA